MAVGVALILVHLLMLYLKPTVFYPEGEMSFIMPLYLVGIAISAGVTAALQGPRRIRERQEYAFEGIKKKSAAQWEQVRAAVQPGMSELTRLGEEFMATADMTGWQLTTEAFTLGANDMVRKEHGEAYDPRLHFEYVPLFTRRFAKLREGDREDTELIRSAVNAATEDLRMVRAAFFEAVACYWEAVAAGSELEIFVKTAGLDRPETSFKRYVALMEQLFSRSVRAMLQGVLKGEDPAEFKATVKAIKAGFTELKVEIVAERRKNLTEAYNVLGLTPKADAGEVNRTCQGRLELWTPEDDNDEQGKEETEITEDVLAFMKERGCA